MNIFDPGSLTAISRDVRQQANEIAVLRVKIRGQAQGLRWQSSAAAAFVLELSALLAQMQLGESHLFQLESAVNSHAATAMRRKRYLNELAAAAKPVVGALEEAVGW